MKTLFLTAILAAFFLAGCGGGTEEEPQALRAREFVTELDNGNYARALSQGGDTLRSELGGVRGLQRLWLSTLFQAGGLQSVTGTEVRREGGRYVTVLTADHVNRVVVWTLVYGAEEVPALQNVSVSVQFKPQPPPRGLPASIIEEVVIVGEHSGYPLDARLTLPRNIPAGTQIPAVILVHSHGPWDMDASVFDNRPFRDIAWHLAENGIAVLRYDKITYRYPLELNNFFGRQIGFELETVFDAGWARVLLLDDPRIDQGRVYVLGHGFGGSAAPLIAEMYGFAGWISMAGSPRTLVELAADRQMFAAVRDGRGRMYIDGLRESHAEAAELFSRLYYMEAEEATELEILGMNGYFLRSLLLNPPSDSLRNDIPALVLQGMNDFEVFFDRDFEMFKEFLSENGNAEFRIYEGVNHMFMWSTMEQPDLRDYMPPARVETAILDDIVEWINR